MKNFFDLPKSAVQLSVDKEFITTSDAIFQELIKSKLNGSVIGIASPLLGAGMFLTGIEDILLEGKRSIVILKRYDVNGHFLSTNNLPLDKIMAVCPFKSKFENPFLAKVTGERSNIGFDESPPASIDEVSLT